MDKLVSEAVDTALVLGFLVLAGCTFLSFSGCAVPLEVDVGIDVGIDDECLFLFPECDTRGYRCVNADGTENVTCDVACVAARDLTCEADGPTCTQRVGDEEHWVPVVCRSNGLGD